MAASLGTEMTNHEPRTPLRCRRGLTLLEVLLGIAVASVLLGLGTVSVRPPALRVATDAMQSVVQQARFEAIRSNRPVVIAVADGRLSTHRASTSAQVDCAEPGPVRREVSVADYRGVRIDSASGFAFVWLPSGEPRTCPAGTAPLPAAGAELVLSDASRSIGLRVSAGGELVTR